MRGSDGCMAGGRRAALAHGIDAGGDVAIRMPIYQINNTHLHANLQRYLIRLENQLTHAIRTDMHLNFEKGIPSLSREEVVEVVQTAWRMMKHESIARVGYMQTGATLPLNGPIRRDQIGRDLITVLDDIDANTCLYIYADISSSSSVVWPTSSVSCAYGAGHRARPEEWSTSFDGAIWTHLVTKTFPGAVPGRFGGGQRRMGW